LYSAEKRAKHGYFLLLIFDQISIALNFIILAPEFERACVKSNCGVVICLGLCG